MATVLAIMPGGEALPQSAATYHPQIFLPHTVTVHIIPDGTGWFNDDVRNDIVHAFQQWNQIDNGSEGPVFVLGSDWGSWQPCSDMTLDVEVRRADISNLAVSTACSDIPGVLDGGRLTIDSDPRWANNANLDWYRVDCGSGGNGNQISLCGVLTHEFGHIAGMYGGPNGGHYPDDDGACSNPFSMMCSGDVWAPPGTDYTNWWKASTLEGHDEHTFQYAY